MGFNCGIVGLPNVGKSTLFNALTATVAAQSANYPFCTIESNVGRVAVPDARLAILSNITHSQKIIPTSLEFVDIAGLVKGASHGEGLGNQFLANIREVDTIIHVLRCFENDDITHVAGSVNPIRDAEIIETELMIADLESLEKRTVVLQKKARGNDKEAQTILELIAPLIKALRDGKPVRDVVLAGEEKTVARLQLLTSKPVLYVCNVNEEAAATGNEYSQQVIEMAKKQGAEVVVVSADIEAEVSQLGKDDQIEFLSGLGLENSGLDRVITAGYKLLNLITYFTCGPKETRAWTISKGTKAPQAAAVIHNDFERGFIACETIAYNDYVQYKGETGAKEAGKVRIEGKDYIVHDGDILLFRFNV